MKENQLKTKAIKLCWIHYFLQSLTTLWRVQMQKPLNAIWNFLL